jgi:hypothetical protein
MLMEQARIDAAAAKRTNYALAFAHLIEEHPLFAKLNWDSVEGDQFPYDVAMGEATSVHFNPDLTYPAVVEERKVNRVATVRPLFTKNDNPIMARGFGTPSERLKWSVDAVVNKFMASFVSGRFISSGTITQNTAGLWTFVSAGPHWDLSARGQGRGGGLLVVTKTGGVYKAKFRAYFDTDFGAETADLAGGGAVVVTLQSANPYYTVTVSVDQTKLTKTEEATIEFDTSSSLAFDGVKTLVYPSLDLSVATGAGENFGFEHLDTLDDALKGDSDVLVLMPGRTFNAMKAEARAVPGVTLEAVQGLKDTFRYAGGRMLLMREPNIPINITHGGTPNCTYLVAFGLNTGIRGIFSTKDRAEAQGRVMAGLSIRDTGELEDSDHDRTKVVGYWSIWNPQRQGLVILNGIKN